MTIFKKKGQIDIYEPIPKKKKPFDWEGLFGFIFLVLIVMGLITHYSG